MKRLFYLMAVLVLVASCNTKNTSSESDQYVTVNIGKENSKYLDAISIYGKEVLNLYRFAAMEVDSIYWKQSFGDKQVLDTLSNKALADYAMINYGPWDRLTGKTFVPGYPAMPAGMMFYPQDMTQEEWDNFADPDKESPYTVIRRNEDGSLKTVWYHDEYSENITRMCNYLQAAADLTIVPSVREYLLSKIEALKTDDYRESEIKWLQMDNSKMDLVIGPGEVEDDNLYGIKKSYSAYVVLKDLALSEELSRFDDQLPALQASLPCKEEYKDVYVPGKQSTIFACEALYYAGAANCGIKDIAISLPFDEAVEEEMGTRTILMENVMSAKFNLIIAPLSDILLSDTDRANVDYNAFFWNVAFREIAHGLGVRRAEGSETVEEALKAMASPVEEAKALAVGAYLSMNNITNFETSSIVTKDEVMATFLASILRSSRFGEEGRVGKGNLICYNYLKEQGAYEKHHDGSYYINYDAFEKGLTSLCETILNLQAEGSYEAAAEFVGKYGKLDDDLKSDIHEVRLENVPADVKFNFVW